MPLLTGTGFGTDNAFTEPTTVIVNRSFVQFFLGGGDPLGRRVRFATRAGDSTAENVGPRPWFEIVGVVPDFPKPIRPNDLQPKLYRAMVPEGTGPVFLILHVRGAPSGTFAERLREITVSVDPLLRLESVGTLDDALRQDSADQVLRLLVALVSLSVVLLSAAGIYALMSYTISTRRREIGIRSALGAGPRTLVRSVLSRATAQIACGIVLGTSLAGLVAQTTVINGRDGRDIVLPIAAAALMTGVGLLATAVPARRALSIQPTEALKGE